MPSNPQRQHWVPQFYLRQFAVSLDRDIGERQVWMFSKLGTDGDSHITGVKNVAVERHLYSPIQEDGTRNFDIEKKLSELEGLMSMRWGDIGSKYVDLGKEEMLKKTLALFIAIQMMRTRSTLKSAFELHREMVDFFDALPKDDGGNPMVSLLEEPYSKIDPTSWDSYRHPVGDRIQQSFAEQIFPVGFNLVDYLLAKRWSIVVAREPLFMTSDRPVTMNHPYKQKFGIRTKGTTITFPLSPTRMLLLNDDLSRAPNRYWKLKPGGQHWFNLITWAGCDRFVFAPFDPVISIEEARVSVEQTFHKEKMDRHRNPSKYKIGRNEPCDCGSGEKWKRCCGKPQ